MILIIVIIMKLLDIIIKISSNIYSLVFLILVVAISFNNFLIPMASQNFALSTVLKSCAMSVFAAASVQIQPVAAQSLSCPVNLRIINAAVEKAAPVDVAVNGRRVLTNVRFRNASKYVNVRPGAIRVEFFRAGTQEKLAERVFSAAPNGAYSVAITGPVEGPEGEPLFNKSPFVIQEDLTPTNPGKFKGKWYRFSETTAVVDLRISKPDTPEVDETRLTDTIPKTAVAYPELTAGKYNFNPVLPKKSEPLINNAFTPPQRVEVSNQDIPAGAIFDVIATGNALGKGPNSLTLTTAVTRTTMPSKDGCTKIAQ
jgi:Domain of unknown function (DUF4397)